MNNSLNDVQKKLLDMLRWFVGYLDANNYRYYIIGGTLLGACRHKGFIPWDDDIDIGMPRKDYERLISSFSSKIDHYILENYKNGSRDYFLPFSKLYDMNTTLIMISRKPLKRGVFIDVFPIDGVGNYEKKEKNVIKKICKLKRIISRRNTALRKEYGMKNLFYFAYRVLPFNSKRIIKKIHRYCTNLSYEESTYVGNLVGSYYEKEIMEKNIFGTPALYQFEDLLLKGPEKYNEYLTNLYGDWKKIPPIEKRITHTNESIDLNKPFSKEETAFNIFHAKKRGEL